MWDGAHARYPLMDKLQLCDTAQAELHADLLNHDIVDFTLASTLV